MTDLLPFSIQDRDTQTETHCLNISPTEMQKKLEEKCQELLERCRGELLGDEQQKEALVQDVGQELRQMMEGFMSTYEWRFKEVVLACNPLGLFIFTGGGWDRRVTAATREES